MKSLLDLLTLPLSLPVSPVLDYLICLIIGEIAFRIAYYYAGEYGYSSSERKLIHWVIRIPLYFVIWLVACAIILAVRFIEEHWILVTSAIGAAIVVGAIVFGVRRLLKRKKPVKSL